MIESGFDAESVSCVFLQDVPKIRSSSGTQNGRHPVSDASRMFCCFQQPLVQLHKACADIRGLAVIEGDLIPAVAVVMPYKRLSEVRKADLVRRDGGIRSRPDVDAALAVDNRQGLRAGAAGSAGGR